MQRSRLAEGGPPAPRTQHGGGVAANPRICRGPFSISSVNCCDGVAMRAFSGRCQLKSLRDEVGPAFEPQQVSGRGPPRPPTHMVGGSRRPENLPGPIFHFKRQNNCCDGVAMRAVSSRCRLKSLRDEWRRPLSHRRRAEGGTPASQCKAMDASGPTALSCCACFQHEACGDYSCSHVV